MIDRYKSLMDAARIISKARSEVSSEDGTLTSPAWSTLSRAVEYLIKQANLEWRKVA